MDDARDALEPARLVEALVRLAQEDAAPGAVERGEILGAGDREHRALQPVAPSLDPPLLVPARERLREPGARELRVLGAQVEPVIAASPGRASARTPSSGSPSSLRIAGDVAGTESSQRPYAQARRTSASGRAAQATKSGASVDEVERVRPGHLHRVHREHRRDAPLVRREDEAQERQRRRLAGGRRARAAETT